MQLPERVIEPAEEVDPGATTASNESESGHTCVNTGPLGFTLMSL